MHLSGKLRRLQAQEEEYLQRKKKTESHVNATNEDVIQLDQGQKKKSKKRKKNRKNQEVEPCDDEEMNGKKLKREKDGNKNVLKIEKIKKRKKNQNVEVPKTSSVDDVSVDHNLKKLSKKQRRRNIQKEMNVTEQLDCDEMNVTEQLDCDEMNVTEQLDCDEINVTEQLDCDETHCKPNTYKKFKS